MNLGRKKILYGFVLIALWGTCFGIVPCAKGQDALAVAYKKTEDRQKKRTEDSCFLEAVKDHLVGHTGQALDGFMQVLSLNDNHAMACYEIAKIKLEQNKVSEAIVYGEKAYRLDPKNEWIQVLLAQLYENTRQYELSAESYKKLSLLRPDNLDYAYECANMYVYQGKLKMAIGVFDALEQRLGITDAWSMQKYKLYSSMENKKAAREEIEKIRDAIPGEVKYYEILAQMDMKENRYRDAYHNFQKILKLNPENPYIYISLADFYQKTEDFEAAFKALEKGIANPKLDFQTKVNVLSAYYTKEEKTKPSSDLIKQASMLFETLLEGHPKEASGYSLYGKFLWRYSDSKKAQSMFEKALLLDSTSAINWELLLTIADVNKDTSVSLHYAQRAIQLFPEQAIFYLFPAAVYSMQKENLSQTIFYAQKARQLCMENNSYNLRMSLVFLGEAYSELKEYDSAISIYEILIKLDPKSKVIKNNYAYQLALKGRNLEEAERLMADLCKENPNDPTFLDTYAWVLFKKGDYKKAKTLLEDALKMDKKMDPTVVEHYGDVLFKLGELEEALEQWKRASRLSSFPNEILIEKINQQQWISE